MDMKQQPYVIVLLILAVLGIASSCDSSPTAQAPNEPYTIVGIDTVPTCRVLLPASFTNVVLTSESEVDSLEAFIRTISPCDSFQFTDDLLEGYTAIPFASAVDGRADSVQFLVEFSPGDNTYHVIRRVFLKAPGAAYEPSGVQFSSLIRYAPFDTSSAVEFKVDTVQK